MAVATKKRVKKNVPEGIVFIYSTFNNTIVTISDKQGNVVSWCSAGVLGFKGSRKSTPFAAQNALADAAKKATDFGMRKVEVKVKGPGPGREAALRALINTGLEVSKIIDVTPIPHNGCKPPKRRRVEQSAELLHIIHSWKRRPELARNIGAACRRCRRENLKL